jgi:hypothetical protein
MSTNPQGTQRVSRPGEPNVTEPTPTPVVTPGVTGSVAVYDQDVDGRDNRSLRPGSPLSSDPVPVETRSTGSILSWIIGAILLIIVAYFILQMIF